MSMRNVALLLLSISLPALADTPPAAAPASAPAGAAPKFAPAAPPFNLQGAWRLTAAYEIGADGKRTMNYGEHAHGTLLVDANGNYSLHIFSADRPKFASNDKHKGTPEEYRAAVIGESTHSGHVRVDPVKHQLIFDIQNASFPNWEGTQQVRDYTWETGALTYAVPASASGNGSKAYSMWQRVNP